MAKSKPLVSKYKDLPINAKTQFVGWIDPKDGGFRFKRDEQRSKTWHFGCRLVAWQANDGPVVREQMYIRTERLDNSSSLSLVRQTPKGRAIQFTGCRPSDTVSISKSQGYIKIVGPIEKPDKPIADLKDTKLKKSTKSVVVKDRVFGSIRLDQGQGRFESKSSFRGTEMTISFETTSVLELEKMIECAMPLWKQRQAWFTAWRKTLYEYYMSKLVDNWWEEDYELTEKAFYRLLGWPVGLEFLFRGGKLCFRLAGWSEELFSDHGIDASGTSISDMTVDF